MYASTTRGVCVSVDDSVRGNREYRSMRRSFRQISEVSAARVRNAFFHQRYDAALLIDQTPCSEARSIQVYRLTPESAASKHVLLHSFSRTAETRYPASLRGIRLRNIATGKRYRSGQSTTVTKQTPNYGNSYSRVQKDAAPVRLSIILFRFSDYKLHLVLYLAHSCDFKSING